MTSIALTEVASTGNIKLLKDNEGFAYIKNGENDAIEITRNGEQRKIIEVWPPAEFKDAAIDADGNLRVLDYNSYMDRYYAWYLDDSGEYNGEDGGLKLEDTESLFDNSYPELNSTKATLPSAEQDSSVTITAVDLLQGFSDADDDDLSISGLTATNGALTNNNDGTWSFSPIIDFSGRIDLSYKVVDGNGGSVDATNSFEITASDEAPSPAPTPDPSAEVTPDPQPAPLPSPSPTPEPVVEVKPEPVVEAEPSMATFKLYDFAAPQKIFTRVEQLAGGDLAPFTLNAQINDMNGYNLVSRKDRATKQDDWIRSGRQDDVISARGGSDIVQGRRGDDALNGGAGNDIIFGGRGDDILNGGRGINLLVGGSGQDSFDLRKGRNTVADFEAGDVWSCGTTIENVELSQTAHGVLMTCGTTTTHFVDAIKEDILAGFSPIDALA